MAHSYNKTRLFTRLFHWLFGDLPKFRIILRGYRYEIVDRLSRMVCFGQPSAIDWAFKELQPPARVIQFPPRLRVVEPLPEWKRKIAWINEKCEAAKNREAV
jgi:hypothetical protein